MTSDSGNSGRARSYLRHVRQNLGVALPLVGAGLVGAAHAFVPGFARSYMAIRILRAFRAVYLDGRHDGAIRRELAGRVVHELSKLRRLRKQP